MLMFDYSNNIRLKKYLEQIQQQKSRTVKTPQLEDIDVIYKREKQRATQGRKSVELKVIEYLRANKYNDVAIYVALALAQTKLLPEWSFEDIIAEIEYPTLVPEHLKKYLQKHYPIALPEAEKKKIALEIWKNIIENESQQQLNISKVTDTEKEFKFAHSLNLEKVRDALLNAFKLFEQIKAKDPEFHYDPKDFFTYRTTNTETVSTFLNTLIGHRIGDYEHAPNSIIMTLQNILDTYELSPNLTTYINNIITTLKTTEDVLWPEEDINILSLEDLKRYFNIITSSKEQKRAENILKQYKR